MGKEEIFNYVMETPDNTNPNILRSLLDDDSGSDLPPVTSSDNGKVATVVDGAWAAECRSQVYPENIQHIPVIFNGSSFTTTITPMDVEDGFTYNGVTEPSFSQSQLSVADLYVGGEWAGDINLTIYERSTDGPLFRSNTGDLSDLGMVGKVGFLMFSSQGNNQPYLVDILSWDKGGKFIVTLTPTALDYSGTMDKTLAEINEAYDAGMEVVFHTLTGANDWVETPLAYYAADGSDYHGFSTTIIQISQNLLIVAWVASA